MKKHIYLFVSLLYSIGNFAQITQLEREEIEFKEGGVGDIAILGDQGFILYGEAGKSRDKRYEVRFFSNELVEKDKIDFPLPTRYKMVAFCMSDNNSAAHFLFVNKRGKFQLNTVQMETGNVSLTNGTLPKKMRDVEMVALHRKLFVSGTIRSKDILFSINSTNGKLTMITIPETEKHWVIRDMAPYPDQDLLAVSVQYRPRKKTILQAYMHVLFYDENGKRISKPLKIKDESGKNAVDANVYWVDDNHFILSGTYSTDKDFNANGLYMAEFKNDEQQFIRYHNFADMENFHEYLSERRKKRVEKKVKKKKAKGRTNAVEVNMVLHPIQKFNDQYVIIGEAYFPTYQTHTTTTFVNGQPQTTTHTVFDGYMYTHATILGMDAQGNKLWDHCFYLDLNSKPFTVITNVNATISDEDVKLFYPSSNTLRSMIIDTENNRTERSMGELQPEVPGEKIKWSSSVSSEHWYDNYFIVHGKQRIKGEDGKRTVFFVSKIEVDVEHGFQLSEK